MEKLKPVIILKRFFFDRGESAKEIAAELSKLSLEEKLSLARDAAKALGVEPDES